MGKSRASESMINTIGSMLENPVYGQKLLGGVGIDPRRLTQVAPIDDGQEPNAPYNFQLTPYLGSLIIDWYPPDIEDQVAYILIEYTPQGGASVLVQTRKHQHIVENLAPVPTAVRIKNVDLWDRESAWSAPITETPLESADYAINMEKARQTGNLTNLITAINASAIDPNNLSETMVKNIALAQGEQSNLLSLIETSYDKWSSGEAWPPADTDVNGVAYITATMPAGNTARVLNRAGVNWLEYTRASGAAAGYIEPFSKRSQRGAFQGREYIASAYVTGNAGTPVRLAVIGEAGDGTQVILGTTADTMCKNTGEAVRLHVKFTPTSTHPYIKLRYENRTAGTVTYWYRNQVEPALGKTEPGPWNSGIFTTGVIGAEMISAIDVNAANALFKNAAIADAKIVNLTAAKITTGQITAGTITLAGGLLRAGSIEFDSMGITMPRDAGGDTSPTVNRNYKIGTSDNKQSFFFYNDSTDRFWGAGVRADGNGSTRRGAVVLQATWGGSFDATSASLEVLGGDWTPAGRGLVRISRGEFYTKRLAGTSISANSSISVSHGLGYNPTILGFYVELSNGLWRALPTSPGAGGIDIFVSNVSSSSLRVYNLSDVAQNVYGTMS